MRLVIVIVWLVLLSGVLLAPSIASLSDPGDFLIRNTVRVSLLFWSLSIIAMIREDQDARLYWTLAWAAFVVHVAVAFEHAHGWRHAKAFQHVEEVSGFGPGIFVSYFFTMIWTADVVWWWLNRRSYETRSRAIGWTIHVFMIFIIINGTVIYESGPIRWVGTVGLLGLLALWLSRKQSMPA